MKDLYNILEGLLDAADPDFELNPLAGYPLISPLEAALNKPEKKNMLGVSNVTYDITGLYGGGRNRADQFDEFQKEFASKRHDMVANVWCCNNDKFQQIIRCKSFRRGDMAYDVDMLRFVGGMKEKLEFLHLDDIQLFKSRYDYYGYYAIKWYPIKNEEIQKYFNNLWEEKYEKFV